MNAASSLKWQITQQVGSKLKKTVLTQEPETGGILGSAIKGKITHFVFDRKAVRHASLYIPNVDFLNPFIAQWERKGIRFVGLIHSHPMDAPRLSKADLLYAGAVLKNFPELEYLLMFLALHKGETSELLQFRIDR